MDLFERFRQIVRYDAEELKKAIAEFERMAAELEKQRSQVFTVIAMCKNLLSADGIRETELPRPKPVQEARFTEQGIAFLKAVRDSKDGALSKELAGALGLQEPRALGPVVNQLRASLTERGFKLEGAVEGRRTPEGRRWLAKPGIHRALQALGGQ